MAHHAELSLDSGHALSWDARAVGRRLKPRPLGGFGERSDVVLDAGRRREDQRPRGVGLDAEGMSGTSGREDDRTGAAALPALGHPNRRVALCGGKLGLDDQAVSSPSST